MNKQGRPGKILKFVISLSMALFGLSMILRSSPRYKKIQEQEQLATRPESQSPLVQERVEEATQAGGGSVIAQNIAEQPLADIVNLAQADFQTELISLNKSLPTLKQFEGLSSAEVHETPEALVQAANRLSLMKSRWVKTSHLRAQARQFYIGCVMSDQIVLPVRATCLAQLRELSLSQAEKLDESTYPPQVIKLADQLLF